MTKPLLPLVLSLAFATSAFSMGRQPPPGVSVLLVPASPALIQVGMDLASIEDAVLMAYSESAAPETPFLHVWNGDRWLPVVPGRFATGTFLRNPASRMVVVGPENDRTAVLIEQALTWCPEVLHLDQVEVTPLINQLGRLYEFSKEDWAWIAQRYQLQLEDLTANTPRPSWYDANRPEDVPMTEKPWKRRKNPEMVPPPPQTSLTPVETEPAPEDEDMPDSGAESGYTLELE